MKLTLVDGHSLFLSLGVTMFFAKCLDEWLHGRNSLIFLWLRNVTCVIVNLYFGYKRKILNGGKRNGNG